MNYTKRLLVKPDQKIKLSDYDPEDTGFLKSKEEANLILQKNLEKMAKLQYQLYAENKRSLLIVFQAMDAGGKDGTIRSVMSGLNPQGCRVTSFKAPSSEELDHDYLWRIHKEVPPKGEIGIFNRSHYEDVLIVRVHDLVPKEVWKKRFDQINDFERYLSHNHVLILKFFLHISEAEQKRRIQGRMEDPKKNWKLAPEDFEERKYWKKYIDAYEDILSRCSRESAPWFVIPANKKWYRNVAVSSVILETLEGLSMSFPKTKVDLSKYKML